jgi:ATP-dependent Clp protease ATP-binding subunit ClpC
VAKALSELSYNKQFGARPLARLITTHIENPLSDKLLSGEINEGDCILCQFTYCAVFEIIKKECC